MGNRYTPQGDSVDTGATMTGRATKKCVKPLYYNTLSFLKEKVNKYKYGSEVSTVGSEKILEIENDYKCQRLSTDAI